MGKTAFSGSDISDNKQPLEHEQHSQNADNNTYNNESYTLKATLMSPFTITVEIWTYYRKH
jgi:ABC-type xylose transport system substrate-binding protein